MKVTDELLAELLLAAGAVEHDGADPRRAFEEALADVPEPDDRIAELEAKLERARAWAMDYPISADLLDILEGKP